MHKLQLIDLENFILEGEFERFKAPAKSILDVDSVIRAVDVYDKNFVKMGLALGHLNDGFLIIPTEDGEKVDETEKDPAFMVVEAVWNPEKKGIKGKILILDSEDGLKIKEGINKGMNCYISSSETDSGNAIDRNSGRLMHRIIEIKGYRLSMMDY